MKKWMHKVALKIWAHYSTQSFLQWCLSCIKAMWENLANICMCLWFYHLTGPIKTILVGHSESYVFVLPLFIPSLLLSSVTRTQDPTFYYYNSLKQSVSLKKCEYWGLHASYPSYIHYGPKFFLFWKKPST